MGNELCKPTALRKNIHAQGPFHLCGRQGEIGIAEGGYSVPTGESPVPIRAVSGASAESGWKRSEAQDCPFNYRKPSQAQQEQYNTGMAATSRTVIAAPKRNTVPDE